jgi:alpha-mannosidase
MKRSEDGKSLILRGHELMGKRGRVTVVLDHAPTHAWLADLTERPTKRVPVQEGRIQFDCNPFEFVTLRLDEKP